MKRCLTRIKHLQFFLLLLVTILSVSAHAHPSIHHPHDWLDGLIHILTEADHVAIFIAAVVLILFIRGIRRKTK